MLRNRFSIVLIVAAAGIATAAPSAKPKVVKKKAPVAAAVVATPAPAEVTLADIFVRQPTEVTDANGMVSMEWPNTDVLVARINDDGTRETACVNSEASAKRFMTPVTATPQATAAPKEQH